MQGFFEFLNNLDRRWYYLFVAVIIAFPLIKPLGLPIAISTTTKQSFEVLNTVQPGDVVLMGFNYNVSSAPDVHPGAEAIFDLMMQKGVRVVAVAFTPQGDTIAEQVINDWEARGKVYGEDFINLGYVAGFEAAVAAVCSDPYSVGRDYRGIPVTPDLPVMQGIKNAADFKLGIPVNTGNPGAEEWIRQVVEPYKLPMVTIHVTIGAPRVMPYVQSGQVDGLIIGLRGSAELEQLMRKPGLASGSMDCQSLGHFAILALMLLGNLAQIAQNKKGGKAK